MPKKEKENPKKVKVAKRKNKVVVVSGTPGTGKSHLAKIIQNKLYFKRIKQKEFIAQHNLCEKYDQEKECEVIDLKKYTHKLKEAIKKNSKDIVIDSHLAHHLEPKYVDLCVITKCNLKILKKRLEKRDYSPKKVKENLEAETFDNCLVEAAEKGHNVLIIDTSHDINKEITIEKIKNKLNI